MRSTITILVIGIVLAFTLIGGEKVREYYAISNLPPPVSTQTPNVLLIVLDTVRSQSLSLYGYYRKTTPRLSEFAQSGVRFDKALSTSPWTLPSHGSMFTGYFSHQLSTNWRSPLDSTYPTLAEELNKSGYLTAGFVANLEYCSYVYGINRGFLHYEDFEISPGQLAISASLVRKNFGIPNFRWFGYYELLNRKTAPELNRDFLNWLAQTKKEGRPFFAFLNYFDAHEPYLPPAPFNRMFATGPPSFPFADLWRKYTPQGAQSLRDLYEGAIAYLDSQIGILLQELKTQGILDNTIVIITSDHGEEFSEHGIPGHGHSLYISSLHVPLVISFPPRVPAGGIVSEWVSLRDLPATIIDLIKPKHLPQGNPFPGDSLARYWDKHEMDLSLPKEVSPILSELRYAIGLPEWFPVSKGDMKSMFTQNLHFIVRGDGQDEIYNLRHDPWETQDLSEAPLGHALSSCLKDQLHAALFPNSKETKSQQVELTAINLAQLEPQKESVYLPCNNLRMPWRDKTKK